MAANVMSEKDQKFASRIQSAVATVEAWDADPLLLAECRAMIPFREIMESDDYKRNDDVHYEGNALFLKRLALFFKTTMTWVNSPPCQKCNSTDNMSSKGVRGPTTVEEREGGASRVEMYACQACNEETTFPRYNSPRKLLEMQQGRCGEYANLFGLYCRAAGFETRYILDVTDHVWTEVWIGHQWIMADSCEGVIGEPSMYEAGWGKDLSYQVGVSKDGIMDVTPRYTRKFNTPEFQARRRKICSSDAVGDAILQNANRTLRTGLTKGRLEELNRRDQVEQALLERYKQTTEWIHGYKEGRTSGSLAWRASRLELGKEQDKSESQNNKTVAGFQVESFYPNCENGVTIEVTCEPTRPHGGIVVSGVACAVGQPNSISLVVVDEASLGCILQSKSFVSWTDLADFVDTLPRDRIVAVCGSVAEKETSTDSKVEQSLQRLGGFAVNDDKKKDIMYIGMVERYPKWASCVTSDESKRIRVVISAQDKPLKTSLRTEQHTMPQAVATRLPETVMPLQTQLLSNEAQKQTAFLSFLEKTKRYSGYTTRPKAPVYLLDQTAYPFERGGEEDGAAGTWNTFQLLPDPLVPQDDKGIVDQDRGTGAPKFDVPLDASFFSSLLGPNLLVDTGTTMETPLALHNARLVALYFSAHWCGPCRRFTPMLSEMYTHLKEEVAPTHGLEIVFVSSDRDPASFQQYYGTMPWLAVPYQAGRMLQQQISARFGVRGIPALVVLDAVSGQIVVSMAESRTDVTRACQGGDQAIEGMLKNNWFAKIPRESQEIMEMLAMSCEEEAETTEDSVEENSYLVRAPAPPVDPAVRIKEIFSKLVAEGETPNEAAAKAIQLLSQEQKGAPSASLFDEGPLQGSLELNPNLDEGSPNVDQMAERVCQWNDEGKAVVRTVVSTALKYLDNAIREPWTPKFRSFKLSNKIFDRITRIEGGLGLLCSMGFFVYGTQQDFMACIPLAADLDRMHAEMTRVLEAYTE